MAECIQEGFLCPICHKDLRSPNNLIQHFQDLHSDEQDILKSIKDLYGKAKKKILKLDEQDELFKSEVRVEKYCVELSEPQEAGISRSITEEFKSFRRDRLDHRTTETNKLIIRLDRLLRFFGGDRKQQEQDLVAWLDGATVTRCPSCASSFNITRRQHHCRLCGSIMCNACSFFMSYETAQSIVAPVHSNRSVEGSKDSQSLRVCEHCLDMLESRRKAQIEQVVQPIICQLYQHLQNMKSQVHNSVEMYQKILDSLTSGETTYVLQDAHSLRASLARNTEMLDTLSKKIASLPTDETNPKQAALQSSIRKSTSMYIKDYLLTLPPPPTAEELEKIKKGILMKPSEDDLVHIPKIDVRKVTVTTGWSPSNVQEGHEPKTDPLIEQMTIVRGYIEQARKAQRFEEVASLRENLNMLKENYKEQQRQKQQANA